MPKLRSTREAEKVSGINRQTLGLLVRLGHITGLQEAGGVILWTEEAIAEAKRIVTSTRQAEACQA